MLEPGLDQLLELGNVVRHFAADESGAGRGCQRAGVEMRLLIAERSRRGQPRLRRGRRHLAAGHAVDLVVEHQAGQLEIAPAGVDQMIAADGETVAVAGDDDDMQIGTRQREAGRIGQRPAVRHMESIGVDIGRQPPGAANAGDDREFVLVDAEIVDRPQQARAARCHGRNRGRGSAASSPGGDSRESRSRRLCR